MTLWRWNITSTWNLYFAQNQGKCHNTLPMAETIGCPTNVHRLLQHPGKAYTFNSTTLSGSKTYFRWQYLQGTNEFWWKHQLKIPQHNSITFQIQSKQSFVFVNHTVKLATWYWLSTSRLPPKFEVSPSRKCVWKYRVRNGGHFGGGWGWGVCVKL